jgi:flagellar biogenesis protein FliO
MLLVCRPRLGPRACCAICTPFVVWFGAATFARETVRASTDSPPMSPVARLPGRSATVAIGTSAKVADNLPSPGAESPERTDASRPAREVLLRRLASNARPSGSDGWYLGMAAITLALALCGGIVAAARRLSSQSAVSEIRVIARACLSPRHTVYLLRVGRRVMMVGAGPQGAPSLICELNDHLDVEPNSRQGEEE